MEVKPYTKKELALAYSPMLSMSGALNRLSSWINANDELLSLLKRSGYQSRQRNLTSYQVRLIFEYLGTP